jgi:hypothetical protein
MKALGHCMNGKAILTVVAASVMLGSVAQAAPEPVVLQPASPWEMNYDNDTCALKRLFGDPGDQVYLELRRFSPDTEFQISVMGERLVPSGDPLRYRFEPSETWQDGRRPFHAKIASDFRGYIFGGWIIPHADEAEPPSAIVDPNEDAIVASAFAKVSGFSVSGGFNQDVTLKTGPLLAPHRAMQRCLDEMLTRWGLDPVVHKTLTRRAIPKNYRAFASRIRYPARMITLNRSGVINIRLSITETGKVSGCHVQFELSDPDFERSACLQMRGAPFDPALDKDGKAIPSYWTNTIVYLSR